MQSAQREPEAPAPSWTADELGQRTSIKRFFGRVFSLFFCPLRFQHRPVCWTAVEAHVALTYAATLVVDLSTQRA